MEQISSKGNHGGDHGGTESSSISPSDSLHMQRLSSDYEIIYDSDDEYFLYKLYQKYELLSHRLDERIAKIKSKRIKK